MAKEAAYQREDEPESLRDTIDSERREEAGNYQFPSTPANNQYRSSSRGANIKNVRSSSSPKRPKLPKKIPTKVGTPPRIKVGLESKFFAWRNFALVVWATSIIYPIQLFFGAISLVGFGVLAGIETDWLVASIDLGTFGAASEAGGGLLIVGMTGAFLCGFISFLIASVIYSVVNKSVLHGFGILVLTICMVGLLCPIINLFPVMLFWYWYMAFAK